jgi:hypothetical protein
VCEPIATPVLKGTPMHNHELTLTELLDDPMTRAVMVADRVDPAALKATLSAVTRKLQHNFVAYQQRNFACRSYQGWLLTPLADKERFSDNDGRRAQSHHIYRMAASTHSHEELPFVRHVLE